MWFPLEDLRRARQLAADLAPHVAHEIRRGPQETLTVRNVHVNHPDTVATGIVVHIRYHVAYAGLEVFPTMITIGMTLDGRIRRVLDQWPTISLPTTTPSLSGPDADVIAVNRSQLPFPESRDRRLIVFAHPVTDPEPARLAWKFGMVGRSERTARKIGHETIVVDAHTGGIRYYQRQEPCRPTAVQQENTVGN